LFILKFSPDGTDVHLFDGLLPAFFTESHLFDLNSQSRLVFCDWFGEAVSKSLPLNTGQISFSSWVMSLGSWSRQGYQLGQLDDKVEHFKVKK
jgi:hypothetical protein